MDTPAIFPVRRNTLLLSGAMAVNSATMQLVAALASITFVLVSGVDALLGLGPAIFFVAGALAAPWAGRLMDRLGRVPVLAAGFALSAVGALLTAAGTSFASTLAVVLGFAVVGMGAASVNLARAAAADMYPPSRRARGVAYVLFGAVFGAILGPAVFSPIFRNRELEAAALATPYLVAAAIALLGLAIVLFVRPDPRRIGEALGYSVGEAEVDVAEQAPLRAMLSRPGVVPALLAGAVSFAVMVSIMTLSGYVVVEHRHHAQHLVFPIIGAHVVGMYALMPLVGAFIDRVGRARSYVLGLLLIAASTAGLAAFTGVFAIAALLFGLGLGWSVAFVGATAHLADLAHTKERGKLLGLHDLLASSLGAAMVLLGGYVLSSAGLYALAFGTALVALLPILPILQAPKEARRDKDAALPEEGARSLSPVEG